MMATGIASAATIRVGNQLGRRDITNLKVAGNTCFIMVTLFMGFAALLFIGLRDIFPTFYIDEIEVIEIASQLLVVAAFFQISDGVQVISLGALRGMKDVKIPTLVTFIAYWLVALPLSYYLSFVLNYGPEGIWFALTLGLTIAAIWVIFRFIRLANRRITSANN